MVGVPVCLYLWEAGRLSRVHGRLGSKKTVAVISVIIFPRVAAAKLSFRLPHTRPASKVQMWFGFWRITASVWSLVL